MKFTKRVYKKQLIFYRKKLSQISHHTDEMPAHEVACPECGSAVAMPKLRSGKHALCPVCDYHLADVAYEPFFNPLGYSISSFFALMLTLSFVFMGIKVGEASFNMSLPQAFVELLKNGHEFLAYILISSLFLTPSILLLGCIYVYHSLYFKKKRTYLHQAINLIIKVKPWVMIDIFIISVFVSMVKIQTLADMVFGLSFWALVLLSLLIIRTSIFISPHWLYYQYKKLDDPKFRPLLSKGNIGCRSCYFFNPPHTKNCQICHKKIHHRRPKSLQISLALLIAAVVLYAPANTFPMMITVTPMTTNAANILEGIIYMWDTDAKFIGIVIFCASLMVPLIKILAITILLISAKFKLLAPVNILTKLYRIIEFIGRWSMIDVFVVAIMVTLMHLPGAFALPGNAVIYFCLVVILSMISVTEFDIRLIWDKARETEKNYE